MKREKGAGRREKGRLLPSPCSLLLSPFALLLSPFPVLAQSPAPIADNSFLIEEAYNQEPGVVQHINTFSRVNGGASWAYSFTQEWPLLSQRYQLSYTVPVLHDNGLGTGIGDIALNARYQLLGGDETSLHVAPRLSVLVPTGNEERGRGARGASVQTNLPVSWVPVPKLAMHANAGLTLSPGASPSPFLGASAIWLLDPELNLLVETIWTGGDEESLVLNPGVRWAFNFESGLQIVPGVAYTIGLDDGAGPDAVFLYLSFEHPFRRLPSQ
ncbi:MAG TPA: transporter [Gemmatimonadales bacterium]|jgi:hypothetical protein